MKHFCVLILLLFWELQVWAQTSVKGPIKGTQTWYASNGPYTIVETITIDPNVTLTIEAGTVINVKSAIGFDVKEYASIYMMGTAADSIKISYNGKGKSDGFRLQTGSKLLMNYCVGMRFENLVYAYNNFCDTIEANNSYFSENTYVFFGKGNSIKVTDCYFYSNTRYDISSMYVNIKNSEFNANDNPGRSLATTSGIVMKCIFRGNYRSAIEGAINLHVTSCSISNCETAIMAPTNLTLTQSTITACAIAIEYQKDGGKIWMENDTLIKNDIGIKIEDDDRSGMHIINNKFCNEINVQNETSVRIDMSNNCWCDSDSSSIALSISNQKGSETVFIPLNRICKPCKADAGADANACSDSTVFLGATAADQDETYKWFPKDALNNTESAKTMFGLRNNSDSILSKTYGFIVSNSFSSCLPDTDYVTVEVYPENYYLCRTCPAIAGEDLVICSGTATTLGSSPSQYKQYFWQPSAGLSDSTISNPRILLHNKSSASFTTTYKLFVKDPEASCEALDSVRVTILSEYDASCKGLPPVHIYNAFSPNGDGKNVFFFIDNIIFYPQNTVSVYNRWGNLVFHTSGYQNDWNGGNLPDGVYYYIVSLPELAIELKGNVFIKK